jgi:hypothetical protein
MDITRCDDFYATGAVRREYTVGLDPQFSRLFAVCMFIFYVEWIW